MPHTTVNTSRRLIGATMGLALAGGASLVLAPAAQADPNPNITICHATGADGKWVVQTIDAAAITSAGHDEHQDDRDVIPPFTYVADNTEETVTFEGQNWAGNWAVGADGVAAGEVDETMCAAPEDEETTPPTGEETTPPAEEETTPPVVQTDGVDPAGTNFILVGGGAALILAGGATLVLANRRRGHQG